MKCFRPLILGLPLLLVTSVIAIQSCKTDNESKAVNASAVEPMCSSKGDSLPKSLATKTALMKLKSSN